MTEKNYPSYLDNPKPTRKQTNYERIRNMTAEEMAKVMLKLSQCEEQDCVNCPLMSCPYCKNIKEIQKWLETEVKDE